MHALTDNFRAFLKRINPSPTYEENASRAYNHIKQILENDEGMGELEPYIFLQGSYKRDTAIYTINDVDIVVLCTNLHHPPSSGLGRSYSRDDIFSIVARAIRSSDLYSDKTRIGKLVGYIKKSFRSDAGYVRFAHQRLRLMAIILSTIFTVLGIILALRHEMWRDEVNVWLIARDHSSPIEILRHLRYDGHPGLWHLSVFALRHIFPHPIAMQMLHLIIAAATVYLFARSSPFTRLQKALFIFGYFPFYEYAIISRNYALGILLLFLFCVLFPKRFKRFPLAGFILFLLAHTSIHALIVAISIGLALFVEYIFSTEKRRETNKLQIGIGFSLIALGVVTSFFQLKPPSDYGFAVGWTTKFDPQHLRNVLNLISKVFIPVPQFTSSFWGSNILDKLPASITVHLVLSSLILLWVILIWI